MDAVPGIFKPLFDAARKHRGKFLYPGLPFVFIPSLLASLIVGQFSSNLTYYPNDRPAALELPVRFSQASDVSGGATLLLVPAATDFFLRSSGRGINSVWLSMEPEILRSNSERVTLRSEGLDVGALRGVTYPLIIVVDGEHERQIDSVGQKPQTLPPLQLITPLANWIVFVLLAGAIFGFGASMGFVNDDFVIEKKNS